MRIRPHWAAATVFFVALAAAQIAKVEKPGAVKPKGPSKSNSKASAKKKKSSTVNKSSTTSKAPSGKAAPTKSNTTSKTTKGVKSNKTTKTTKKAAAPRGQMQPSPERYKEIEQALAARGYLVDEPTGKWGASSVEALRNFQSDHELAPTGKLDSLSLIELGLAPKRQ